MCDDICNDLDNKKTKQDDPACEGIILPSHYHKSIIHRDLERYIWHQLFPIHFLAEWNLQDPVIQSFDRQKCQKDSQKECVSWRLLFLLDEENRIDGWNHQKEIYPSDSLQKSKMILANKKNENQEPTVHKTQCEKERFKQFEAPTVLNVRLQFQLLILAAGWFGTRPVQSAGDFPVRFVGHSTTCIPLLDLDPNTF
jgi:hypothetical protein